MISSLLSLPTTNQLHHDQAIPAKLLHSLVSKQVSGKLTIQNPFDEFVHWQVYLGNGRIHLANSANGARERMVYLIGKTLEKRGIALPQTINDDYAYLCELWKKDIFSFQQIRSILTQTTQEALVQILSLPKTAYTFSRDDELSDLFLNLELDKTIIPIKHKIRYWWELRSYINSPFQRPLVENWDSLHSKLLKDNLHGQHWIKRFHHCLENLNCLYEIASSLEISTLELALILQPLVQTGEIKMLSYQEIQTDQRPLVAYVDQRETRQRVMTYLLENSGFRPLILGDPFKALSLFLNTPPSVIIVHANLGEMNGFQLCNFCRKSSQLKDVPVLLLDERENFIGKIRAKLANASGYLSESLIPQRLVKQIDIFLQESKTIT